MKTEKEIRKNCLRKVRRENEQSQKEVIQK